MLEDLSDEDVVAGKPKNGVSEVLDDEVVDEGPTTKQPKTLHTVEVEAVVEEAAPPKPKKFGVEVLAKPKACEARTP